MSRRSLAIAADCIGAFGTLWILIWMALGHRLDRFDQFFWVGIALAWMLISLANDMRPQRKRRAS